MTRSDYQHKILIVDDDPKVVAFVAAQLRTQGYVPETALSGDEGLDKAAMALPSLVLLDISMPGMDGLEVLTRLRQWYDGPVVILSASHEEERKVQALDLGADDYLTKPFGMRELLARVRAALRRAEGATGARAHESAVVTVGDISIDMARRVVTRKGKEISLTRTEYELLRYMASNLGKVLTHRELLREVWGPEYGEETEYLRTFIKQLRRKLEPEPSRPVHLVTQPGVGYRLVG